MASQFSHSLAGGVWPEWIISVEQGDQASGVRGDRLDFLDERELVAACGAGRLEAFDVIVERHRRTVYQLCYRFAANHEDASDLSQEVFLRAFRGLHRFRGRSSLRTWLYRIGMNVCLNHAARRQPAGEPVDAREHPDTRGEDPPARLERAERAAEVRAALARLPRKQRAALVLRVYHDLSHAEIAGILGCSVGAVKANVSHALGNLKARLAKGGSGR